MITDKLLLELYEQLSNNTVINIFLMRLLLVTTTLCFKFIFFNIGIGLNCHSILARDNIFSVFSSSDISLACSKTSYRGNHTVCTLTRIHSYTFVQYAALTYPCYCISLIFSITV